MGERGTSYTAEIETPSGLTFHASIYIPPDAEYGDQHESAEAAAYAVTRMLTSHERGEEARAGERAEEVGRCGEPAATLTPAVAHAVCCLPAGHDGWHRADDGMEWSGLPIRDPWAKSPEN